MTPDIQQPGTENAKKRNKKARGVPLGHSDPQERPGFLGAPAPIFPLPLTLPGSPPGRPTPLAILQTALGPLPDLSGLGHCLVTSLPAAM